MSKNYNSHLDLSLQTLLKDYENHFRRIRDALTSDNNRTTKGIITNVLREKFKTLSEWEIELIFEKLKEDKFILSVDPFEITHQGVIFIKNGGYRQSKLIENSKILLRFVSSAVLIFGTIIASIYSYKSYDLEVKKFLNDSKEQIELNNTKKETSKIIEEQLFQKSKLLQLKQSIDSLRILLKKKSIHKKKNDKKY